MESNAKRVVPRVSSKYSAPERGAVSRSKGSFIRRMAACTVRISGSVLLRSAPAQVSDRKTEVLEKWQVQRRPCNETGWSRLGGAGHWFRFFFLVAFCAPPPESVLPPAGLSSASTAVRRRRAARLAAVSAEAESGFSTKGRDGRANEPT